MTFDRASFGLFAPALVHYRLAWQCTSNKHVRQKTSFSSEPYKERRMMPGFLDLPKALKRNQSVFETILRKSEYYNIITIYHNFLWYSYIYIFKIIQVYSIHVPHAAAVFRTCASRCCGISTWRCNGNNGVKPLFSTGRFTNLVSIHGSLDAKWLEPLLVSSLFYPQHSKRPGF